MTCGGSTRPLQEERQILIPRNTELPTEVSELVDERGPHRLDTGATARQQLFKRPVFRFRFPFVKQFDGKCLFVMIDLMGIVAAKPDSVVGCLPFRTAHARVISGKAFGRRCNVGRNADVHRAGTTFLRSNGRFHAFRIGAQPADALPQQAFGRLGEIVALAYGRRYGPGLFLGCFRWGAHSNNLAFSFLWAKNKVRTAIAFGTPCRS